MYTKLLILSIALALFAQPCQDPASPDGESFKPDEGTYSGDFTYTGGGGSGKTISGSITFTIQGNISRITDLSLSFTGSDSLNIFVADIDSFDTRGNWFTIFNVPLGDYSTIPIVRTSCSINSDWNLTGKTNEAKCGIAIISADDRDSYGGSAKNAGFIVTKSDRIYGSAEGVCRRAAFGDELTNRRAQKSLSILSSTGSF